MNSLLYPHISVRAGLVPARVSGNHIVIISTGGPKILPTIWWDFNHRKLQLGTFL